MTEPDPPAVDLTTARRVHIVGIGGAGMSAIAEVLAGMGHRVSGSDARESDVLARLRTLGVEAHVGHEEANLGAAEVVAVSTAVGAANRANAEVAGAFDRGLPVLARADLLSAISATKRVIAVSGTHGKTTTSAMLATALDAAGLSPSFIVGARLGNLGGGARWGSGDLLIVEADESDGTFLRLCSEAAIVTSVERDHLGHYGGFDMLIESFRTFMQSVQGPCLACADDEVARRLAMETGSILYGTREEAAYRITGVELGGAESAFVLKCPGDVVAEVRLPLPGMHNVLNAAGALAAGVEIGAGVHGMVEGLSRFPGVARRFERRGEVAGITFVDDYAHLPNEVRAAIAAARLGPWGRIVCVFQPHRFTRTADLHRDFAGAFTGTDLLVVTDVYSAGEPSVSGVSGKLIVDAVLDSAPSSQVAWLPQRPDLVEFLVGRLRPGDLCLTLGAGDLTALPDELLRTMSSDTSATHH